MTMIERVAAAILAASDATGLEYDICEVLLAKAAIAAMREPTEEMKWAAIQGAMAGGDEAYKAAIDAALKE